MNIFVSVPPLCSLSVIKKNEMVGYYIYSDFFFYRLSYEALNNNYMIDTDSNGIVFNDRYKNPYNNVYINALDVFLYSWNFYFYEKIKFTGKGYRITFRKKKKYIVFHFGHSHLVSVLFRSLKLIQPHKYKFVLVKNSWYKLRALSKRVTNIKPMNMYTKRGIRNSRQIILKRKGKKSTYI